MSDKPEARGIVESEKSGARVQPRVRRNEPSIEIAADLLSDEAVGGLIDEWLAPMIADRLVRDLIDTTLRNER